MPIPIIILAVVVLWVIFTYNSFVRIVTRTEEAWADIDVQLKRRYDLIPNLIETVKGYASHESGVLESVTAARVSSVGVSPQQAMTISGSSPLSVDAHCQMPMP